MKKAKRIARTIPELKQDSVPKRFLFFDTETTPIIADNGVELQQLKVGVARYIERDKNQNITTEHELVFYTQAEFMDFVLDHVEPKQKLTLYAHNIAFDLMVLQVFDYFYNAGYPINPPIQSGMRFLWNVKTPQGNIGFINVGNFCPFPLKTIGADLGFEKLDIDFDNTNMKDLITYCTRDVFIIERFIFKFIDFLVTNNLGTFKSTIASQALSVYRHSFMNTPITLHNNLLVNTVERDSYTGGRTEAFFIGDIPEDKIYGLDINSMYPFVMTTDTLPREFNAIIHNAKLSDIDDYLKNSYCIVDVTINTNEPFHGVKYSDYRFKITNTDKKPYGRKLIFPTGQFRTLLHHDELTYAIENDYIKEIHYLYIYTRGDLFTDYVNFFTKIKEQATKDYNKTDRLIAKLFLNSLYGKFGQLFHDQIKIQENVPEYFKVCEVLNLKKGQSFTDFIWYGDLWREYTNGEASYSFPAIAGAITARARMLLWDYIKRVGIENVYYCDTDSLYTNEHGYNILKHQLHDTKLGAMAVEKILTDMHVNGAKDYSFEGQRVVKGVPKNAQWLNNDVSISTRFEGWREYRNDGLGRPPKVWKQLKIKTLEYDKGIISDSGHVIPYNIIDS